MSKLPRHIQIFADKLQSESNRIYHSKLLVLFISRNIEYINVAVCEPLPLLKLNFTKFVLKAKHKGKSELLDK